MARIDFNNDRLLKMLDDIASNVPDKVPEAIDAITDMVRPKLIARAPYDGVNHKQGQKHLREVIVRTEVRGNERTGRYATIFVKPRGIRGASQGRRAKKNWDKDKQVFKLVVAEHGSSKQEPKPFWNDTVDSCEDEAYKIAEEIILSEVDRLAN